MVRKICLMLSVVFMSALIAYGYMFVSGAEPPIAGIEPGRTGSPFKKMDPLTVLIVGRDEIGHTTDSMMLVRYKPNTNDIVVFSIPRDTRIWYGNFNGIKINEVYSNAEYYQHENPMEDVRGAVESILSLEIDHYILFDTKAFRETIDILGGIDFKVPYRIYYNDSAQNLHIDLYRGEQHLNGDQTEQLMRFRQFPEWMWWSRKKGVHDGSDTGRIKMQQKIIKSIVDQKFNVGMATKANKLVGEILPKLVTDMPKTKMLKLASSISDSFSIEDNVKFKTLPGTPEYINNLWYFIPDYNKTRIVANKYLREKKDKIKKKDMVIPNQGYNSYNDYSDDSGYSSDVDYSSGTDGDNDGYADYQEYE